MNERMNEWMPHAEATQQLGFGHSGHCTGKEELNGFDGYEFHKKLLLEKEVMVKLH